MSPRDPRLRSAYRSFRKNLTAILRQAAAAAPAVVACTVPVNLRDCAPFSTSFLDDETAAQEVREILRAAVAAETATNRTDAARLYADAIRRDPNHAEALFRAARLALAANRTAEAGALFSRARDADALRLRADSRINDIIRANADEAGVSLLDAEALFAIRSPQGIPGQELFLDHVHFTFAGAHLLAASILDRLEFLRVFDAEPTGAVPDAGAVAAELRYDPWGAAAQLEAALDQQFHPPFRRQLTNAETLARLSAEKNKADARAAAFTRANACAVFDRRRAARPDDPWLAARPADGLLHADAGEPAEAAAAAALARWPHRFEIRARLALARALLGQPAAEGLALLREPDEDTGYYDVVQAIDLGRELLRRKQPGAARPWLEYAWVARSLELRGRQRAGRGAAPHRRRRIRRRARADRHRAQPGQSAAVGRSGRAVLPAGQLGHRHRLLPQVGRNRPVPLRAPAEMGPGHGAPAPVFPRAQTHPELSRRDAGRPRSAGAAGDHPGTPAGTNRAGRRTRARAKTGAQVPVGMSGPGAHAPEPAARRNAVSLVRHAT